MKCIGRGFQYSVYDLGKRVLKKENCSSYKDICVICSLICEGNILGIPKKLEALNKSTEESIKNLKKFSKSIDMSLFGNPTFNLDQSSNSYEQDKVETIKSYFTKHNLSENKKIIDEYVTLSLSLWKYGVSDTVFNFTINSGVLKKQNKLMVVQLDLGELTFSQEEISELIKEKKWLQQHSYRSLKDAELRMYYEKTMDKYINLDNLNKFWSKKRQKN